MKFIILLGFLVMLLANPIAGGKLFPGFKDPEKWMKRVIRKLQRKTSAYGNMIASNTAEISNTAGFISSIAKCEYPFINDPDYGLRCCFEDNSNEGQCLCNGMTIDDESKPGSCCTANQRHPDHCLCSGTDIDDPNNPGNCCFKDENNPTQCLCNGNYTDNPNKRCFNLDWKGDGVCDDENNHAGCDFDGKDCCGEDVDTDLCTLCQCLEEEAPLPNAVGCCYPDPNNTGECLCTGLDIDDPDNAGSCCVEDPDSPGTCCVDSITCNGQGTCSSSNNGVCTCDSGFTGDRCNVTTCPGVPVCSDSGSCPQGGTVCNCQAGFHGDDCATFCIATTTCSGNGTCGLDGICQCDTGLTGSSCNETANTWDSGLILVCAGWGHNDCEVFNVKDETKSCNNIADYPLKVADPAAAIVDGTIMVCGGYDGFKDCYIYDITNDAWNFLAELPADNSVGTRVRGGIAALPLNGAMWMCGGGSGGSQKDKLTRFIYPNGTMILGTPMPRVARGHSATHLPDGRIMITGTDGGSGVVIYSPSNDTYEVGPSMKISRTTSVCCVIITPYHSYRPVVMCPGDNRGGRAEVYDYTVKDVWETDEEFTMPVDNDYGVQVVSNENGATAVVDDEILILTCDASSCNWNIMNQKCKKRREQILLNLPESGFSC